MSAWAAAQLAKIEARVAAASNPDDLCFLCRENPPRKGYRGKCARCYMGLRRQRAGTPSQPLYFGPCQEPAGCTKIARSKSKLCRHHYEQRWWRTRRRERVLERLLGVRLKLADIEAGLAEVRPRSALSREALAATRLMLAALRDCRLWVARSPWPRRREVTHG